LGTVMVLKFGSDHFGCQKKEIVSYIELMPLPPPSFCSSVTLSMRPTLPEHSA
jgi:hypothetical protein